MDPHELVARLAATRASHLESQEGMRAAQADLENERARSSRLAAELEAARKAMRAEREGSQRRRSAEYTAAVHAEALVEHAGALSEQNDALRVDSSRLREELAERELREMKIRAASAEKRSTIMLQKAELRKTRTTAEAQLEAALDALRAEREQKEALKAELNGSRHTGRAAAARVDVTLAQLYAERERSAELRANLASAEQQVREIGKQLKHAAQEKAEGKQRESALTDQNRRLQLLLQARRPDQPAVAKAAARFSRISPPPQAMLASAALPPCCAWVRG